MQLSSPTITDTIPLKYACRDQGGKNISPPLKWTLVPGATHYQLQCSDPDAPHGTFIHWNILYIPPNKTFMTEGDSCKGCRIGANSYNHNRWDGPCPPSGTHRYIFQIFAFKNNDIVATDKLVATFTK